MVDCTILATAYQETLLI